MTVRILVPACKGRLVGCPLGGQHTDLAGFVIECGREAVCFLVQKRRDRKFSREVVLGHFDAAGVAEMVAVRVGVVEPLSLSAADGAGLPVTVLVCVPVAVGAAGHFDMAGIVGADALVCTLPSGIHAPQSWPSGFPDVKVASRRFPWSWYRRRRRTCNTPPFGAGRSDFRYCSSAVSAVKLCAASAP